MFVSLGRTISIHQIFALENPLLTELSASVEFNGPKMLPVPCPRPLFDEHTSFPSFRLAHNNGPESVLASHAFLISGCNGTEAEERGRAPPAIHC